jgi:hypothetical protein
VAVVVVHPFLQVVDIDRSANPSPLVMPQLTATAASASGVISQLQSGPVHFHSSILQVRAAFGGELCSSADSAQSEVVHSTFVVVVAAEVEKPLVVILPPSSLSPFARILHRHLTCLAAVSVDSFGRPEMNLQLGNPSPITLKDFKILPLVVNPATWNSWSIAFAYASSRWNKGIGRCR